MGACSKEEIWKVVGNYGTEPITLKTEKWGDGAVCLGVWIFMLSHTKPSHGG